METAMSFLQSAIDVRSFLTSMSTQGTCTSTEGMGTLFEGSCIPSENLKRLRWEEGLGGGEPDYRVVPSLANKIERVKINIPSCKRRVINWEFAEKFSDWAVSHYNAMTEFSVSVLWLFLSDQPRHLRLLDKVFKTCIKKSVYSHAYLYA